MCNSDIYRDMRNILTIYTQYDGGKVAPELGGKGYSFVHPTPSPPVIFSAQLATQLCRSTFERAGGRGVKQMVSAYSACLLVSW